VRATEAESWLRRQLENLGACPLCGVEIGVPAW
jgi:hypothetical protein